ncbi:rhombotarget lipoprotein [Kangiella sp. TOML190]|uniref:rhombotarget lipoprotein n=1 Tax=Kangiella sp. TOML190 TaxID=2931351 RepID=UPI00203DFEE2|nr:rhombotarget lipoprotein [Kangiella sp. TOML190]
MIGSNLLRLTLIMVIGLFLQSCAGQKVRGSSSVVDYLYSGEQTKVSPSIPHLKLPLKVGIAFVPDQHNHSRAHNVWSGNSYGHDFPETLKAELLETIAQDFRNLEFVEDIAVIPSAYLRPQGGFDNLDQIANMYGVELIALVSYDQVQFTDEDFLSLSYWTIVGAYLVSGEKNDTSTMLDTVVYDISSRSMLFRAPGSSSVKGRSTPVNLSEELRHDSAEGFRVAASNMTGNLELELEKFQEKIKNDKDSVIVSNKKGYSGAGGFGMFEILVLWLLLSLTLPFRQKSIK